MLKDILDAREQRAFRRNELERQYNRAVVSFTINIPMGKKNDLKYRWLCRLAVNEYFQAINDRGKVIEFVEERTSPDGPVTMLVVDEDPVILKGMGIEIEESHPLGRLFDIDVSGMSRGDISLPLRRCIICDRSAAECIVGRRHDHRDVLEAIDSLIENRRNEICKKAAELAIRSMLYEVSCTPKPGLVDMNNNGAHRDMNYSTFLSSITALAPYFRRIAREAVDWYGTRQELFDRIRPLGIKAERDMLTATGGINTHKGQIFSLGLVCTAAAYILQRKGRVRIDEASGMVSDMTKNLVEKDLERGKLRAIGSALTKGEQFYMLHGCKGARGEAAAGFRAAVDTGLPALKHALARGAGFNNAMVHSLVSIMGEVEDTNVISRGGLEALGLIRDSSSRIMEAGSVFTAEGMRAIHKLDCQLIDMNISPGGAADMLALSVFLFFIENIRM